MTSGSPTTIGPYQITRELGRGGRVWFEEVDGLSSKQVVAHLRERSISASTTPYTVSYARHNPPRPRGPQGFAKQRLAGCCRPIAWNQVSLLCVRQGPVIQDNAV